MSLRRNLEYEEKLLKKYSSSPKCMHGDFLGTPDVEDLGDRWECNRCGLIAKKTIPGTYKMNITKQIMELILQLDYGQLVGLDMVIYKRKIELQRLSEESFKKSMDE